MSDPHASTENHNAPVHYEIRIQGHLDMRWADWFDGLTLTHDPDGTTLLAGPLPDQAALHGVLSRIRDLGLPIISVQSLDTGPYPRTLLK